MVRTLQAHTQSHGTDYAEGPRDAASQASLRSCTQKAHQAPALGLVPWSWSLRTCWTGTQKGCHRHVLTCTMPGTLTWRMNPRLMWPWTTAHASTAPDCASGHRGSAPQPYPTHAILLIPARDALLHEKRAAAIQTNVLPWHAVTDTSPNVAGEDHRPVNNHRDLEPPSATRPPNDICMHEIARRHCSSIDAHQTMQHRTLLVAAQPTPNPHATRAAP